MATTASLSIAAQPTGHAATAAARVETHLVELQAVTVSAALNTVEATSEVEPSAATGNIIQDFLDYVQPGLAGTVRMLVLAANTLVTPIWLAGAAITLPLAQFFAPADSAVFLDWMGGPINLLANFADKVSPGIGPVIREFFFPPSFVTFSPAAAVTALAAADVAVAKQDNETPTAADSLRDGAPSAAAHTDNDAPSPRHGRLTARSVAAVPAEPAAAIEDAEAAQPAETAQPEPRKGAVRERTRGHAQTRAAGR